jgi:hypothetical protein
MNEIYFEKSLFGEKIRITLFASFKDYDSILGLKILQSLLSISKKKGLNWF